MTATAPAAPALDPPRLRRARVSVSVGFLLFGLAAGLWFVHIPIVAARLALEPAILGLALLGVGLGGVISQPITGLVVARVGSQKTSAVMLAATLIGFVLPVVAGSIVFLFFGTFLLGALAGGLNVALNTQASEIETLRGRPTMSSFHGFWSLGGLAAAAVGGVIIGAGWGGGIGAIGAAIVMLAIGVWASFGFLPSIPQPRTPKTGGPRFALPGAALFAIAALAFFANMVEGSVNDWSALFLATVKDTGPALAASGYAMSSFAMAACRFAGGPVVERLGDKLVIVGGGALIAIGMSVVVLAPWPLVSAFGFLIVGIGAANMSPVMISAASRVPGVAPGTAVTTVATALLGGFLLGPPVIGFISQAWGLSVGLGLVGCLGLLVAAGALSRSWHSMAETHSPAA